MTPELEVLLQEISTGKKLLSFWRKSQVLDQLDKLVTLETRKLVTLHNLRDSIARRNPK